MFVDPISIKLPAEVRRRLAAEASRRNVAQSVIVREAIEQALAVSAAGSRPATCADLAADLIGAVHSGRRDAATDKTLLEKAMAQGSRYGAKRRR